MEEDKPAKAEETFDADSLKNKFISYFDASFNAESLHLT